MSETNIKPPQTSGTGVNHSMDINAYSTPNVSNLFGYAVPALSAIGSIIGNVQQSNNIDKQINTQLQAQREAQKYNYMLAKQQNQWNLEQWNRENEYNLPINQMKRYLDAGLNPDLIYNQSNLSASSPNMTSGAPTTPVDMTALGQKPTLSEVINEALNANLLSAQTISEIKSADQTMNSVKYLNEQLYNLDADTRLKEQVRQLTEQQYLELVYKNDITKSNLDNLKWKLMYECNIAENEAKYLTETLPWRVLEQENTAILVGNQAYILDCQKGYYDAYSINASELADIDFELKRIELKTNEKEFENFWKIKLLPLLGNITGQTINLLKGGKDKSTTPAPPVKVINNIKSK